MSAKETARQKVAELVEKFAAQSQSYEDPDYNEEQTRGDFINPFFKALGWDIGNEQGHSEVYRDVVFEARETIDGAAKRPDYTFRLGSEKLRLFFVEAKKPSIHLAKTKEPAYQLRRYAWSSNLPVSILTNFKEFAVYDCRHEPNVNDPPEKTRVAYLTYQNYTGGKFGLIEYEDCFDFLWNTFARENIPKGNLDKFVQSDKFEKGYVTVDQKFLLLIEDWRMKLAESLCRYNPGITEEDLNFVVQQTIDRLVFLRIAEDRGIEPYGNVQRAAATSGADECYKNLFTLFERADEKYDSGLFNFDTDEVSGNITIKNNVIKDIVKNLYYPSPYDFSAIPVEIMGNIYEHFLGKTIRLTSGRNAVVEAKPEVKKAGGVYYTPQYIVDYIVQNTVGKLIEGKTPKEVAKIKIVDPACGSGSFLLGAYQFLLDWHQDYYQKHCEPSKGRKTDLLTPSGKLTASVKKDILRNNIFGVDIDMIAVEITKWSLLIKGMEGETEASIQTSLLYKERILPNIDSNICVGNSLVDTDIYDSGDFGDERKIKPFHWQRAFPEVFKQGGFDCVIGNPPYVDFRAIDAASVRYYKSKFVSSGVKEKWSLYILFTEQGTKLLKQDGLYAMIVPNTILSANFAAEIRKLLVCSKTISRIIDVSSINVFGVTRTYPVLLFYQNSLPQADNLIKVGIAASEDLSQLDIKIVSQNEIRENNNKYIVSLLSNDTEVQIIRKLDKNTQKLGEFADVFHWGSSISAFRTYKLSGRDYKRLSKEQKKEYAPVIQTADIKKYHIVWHNEYVHKSIYSEKTIEHFAQRKIVIARLTKEIQATVDANAYFMGKSSYIITNKINNRYLIALLNSRLLNFYGSRQASHIFLSRTSRKILIFFRACQVPTPKYPYNFL